MATRHGSPLPDAILNAPELTIGLELFYLAFLDLTSCRALGYGVEGAISWLAIDEYARRCGYTGEQRQDLFYHISRMDQAYLEYRARKMKKSLEQTRPKKQAVKKRG